MSVLKQYDAASGVWQSIGGMGLPKTPVSFSANKGGTNQTTIVTSTDTKLTFSATSFNNGAGFSTTTSRFTAPIAGVYGVTLSVQWAYPTIADKIYATKLFVNGVFDKMLDESHTSNTNDIVSIGSCFISLNAGDYVEAYVKQFSGSDMAVSGAIQGTVFSMCLIPDSYDASKQITDLSSVTIDYLLQVGETAVINFTSATSVPLRIVTVEGLYEVIISTKSLAASPTNNNVYLSPNNTTYTNAIKSQHTDITGTSVTTGLETRSTFGLSYAGLIQSKHSISTYTLGKSILTQGMFKFNSGAYQTHIVNEYWEDTTTVWSSLGTITLPYAQTGKVVIKRVV